MRSSYTLPDPSPEHHSGTTSRWLDDIAHCENLLAQAAKEAALAEFLTRHVLEIIAQGLPRSLDLQLGGTADAFRRIKTKAAATLAGNLDADAAPDPDAAFPRAFNRMTDIEDTLAQISEDAEIAVVILGVLREPLEKIVTDDLSPLLLGAADAAARIQALMAMDHKATPATDREGDQ